MLKNKMKNLKNKMTDEDFKLVLNIFNQDVEFHKKFKSYTERELCQLLGQASKVVERIS